MEVNRAEHGGGRVQVSTEVISDIAKMATLEVGEVKGLSKGTLGIKGLLHKVASTNPITVNVTGGIAVIDVCIMVDFGTKVRGVAKQVQDSVKSAVQNMTGITVSKVNVIISGIAEQPE